MALELSLLVSKLWLFFPLSRPSFFLIFFGLELGLRRSVFAGALAPLPKRVDFGHLGVRFTIEFSRYKEQRRIRISRK